MELCVWIQVIRKSSTHDNWAHVLHCKHDMQIRCKIYVIFMHCMYTLSALYNSNQETNTRVRILHFTNWLNVLICYVLMKIQIKCFCECEKKNHSKCAFFCSSNGSFCVLNNDDTKINRLRTLWNCNWFEILTPKPTQTRWKWRESNTRCSCGRFCWLSSRGH